MHKIKPHYQQSTRFCTVFAVCHAIMAQRGVEVSVWRVVLNAFRYKAWPFMANRSFSVVEVFETMKKYGVKLKDGELYFPEKLIWVVQSEVTEWIRRDVPLLALLNGKHEICVVDCFRRGKDWHYEIIDSSSKKSPYRNLVNPDLKDFYCIL